MGPREKVDTRRARSEGERNRFLDERRAGPLPPMLRLNPEGSDPGGVLRARFLIACDDGDGTQEALALMRHESRRNGTFPEALPHEAGEQFQRVPFILPERTPDAVSDSLGKFRQDAQIADRDPAQRRVSSRRVMSFWRGAMEEIRPYS